MIIFINSTGTVTNSLPEQVYQGASNANEIYVVAPFVQNMTATIAFRLKSNGIITQPQNLVYQGELSGVTDSDGGKLYGWSCSINSNVTAYYGTVLAQITFYSAGQTVATSAFSFVVGRGVVAELPAEPTEDIYDEILQNISALQSDLNNGYYSARAVYAWNDTYTYGANELVYYPTGTYGVYVKSTVANNTTEPYTNGVINAGWELVIDFNVIMNALSDISASVEAAEQSATSAASSATAAENSSQAAANSATSAEASANKAQQIITNVEELIQKPYSLIIKTQAEFEDFVEQCNAGNLTSDIISVLFDGSEVGRQCFVLSTGNNAGIKLPATLKQLQGINGAKISATEVSDSAIWYVSAPAGTDYFIKDLNLEVEGISSVSELVSGFKNCINLINCTSNIDSYTNAYAFSNCSNLINCTGVAKITTSGSIAVDVFHNCEFLINCSATSNASSSTSTSTSCGFNKCYNLVNCISDVESSYIGYGFFDCGQMVNCTGNGVGANIGYGFYNCSNCSACKSTTSIIVWGGTNTFVDYATCDKNADGTIPGNTAQIPDGTYENLIAGGVVDGAITNDMLSTSVQEAYANSDNLVLNGNFKINQRGQASYTGYNNYTVDGWFIYSAETTITPLTNGGVNVNYTEGNVNAYLLMQKLDGDYTDKVVSLSCSINGVIYKKENFTNSGTLTIGDNLGLRYYKIGDYQAVALYTLSATTVNIDLDWVDLTPTEFALPHKDPDPTLELLRCQSRFLRYKANIAYMKFGYGNTISNSTADIFIPFNNNMDNTLTVVPSGNFNIYMADGTPIFAPVTDMVLRSVSPCGIVLRVTTSSTALAVNAMCYLQSTATTDYIDFDCQP